MKKRLAVLAAGFLLILSTFGVNTISQTNASERQGVDFSGGASGINTGTTFLESPSTFEAWIKLAPNAKISPVGSGRYGVLVGSYISSNATGSINFEIGPNGQPNLYWGGTSTFFTSVDVRTGQWLHLAIVRDEAQQQLHCYVDGALKETISRNSPAITSSNTVWIGRDSRSSSNFTGSIHSVLVSTTVKNAVDLSNSMNNIPSRHDTGVLISEVLDFEPIPTYENNRTTYVVDNFARPINTFSAWIKIPTLFHEQAVGGVIFGNYIGGQSFSSINYEVWTHGNFRVHWNNGQFAYVFNSVDLRTGNWEHIALTRNTETNTFTFYHNGMFKESVVFATTWEDVNHTPYNIGNDCRGSEMIQKFPFYGEIKQVTLYDAPQPQTTIGEDMNDTVITTQNRDDSLIANYTFESWFNKEATWPDTSGNNHHLSLGSYDLYTKDIEVNDDYDYTIAVIPDTQTMVSFNPGLLNGMTKWMADNAQEQKIAFAMQLGDLTNAGSKNHYDVSKQAMFRLDDKMPYTFVLGNHDYDDMLRTNRSTVNFNEAFPYEKYAAYPWFGGAYEEGVMDNYYCVFEVGSIKYLVFALEVGPRTSVLQWANRIITTYGSEYRVITTTHSYVNPYGRLTTTGDSSVISYGFASTYGYEVNNGQEMFDKFVSQHASMMFVFNGHHTYDYIVKREDVGVHGNKVTSMLIDGQGVLTYENGTKTHAEDLIMLMRMNEEKQEAYCYYYSPARDAYYNYQNQLVLSFADENNPALNIPTPPTVPIFVDSGTPTVTYNVEDPVVTIPSDIIIILSIGGSVLLLGEIAMFVVFRRKITKSAAKTK